MNPRRGTAPTRTFALAACGLAATTTLLAGCGNGLQSTAPGSGPVIASPAALPTTRATGSSSPTPSQASSPTSTGSSAGSGATKESGSASSTTSTTSTSGQVGSSDPGTATPSSRSDRCTTGHLQVGVRATDGGPSAGSNYVLLTYRNTGSTTCVLTGFPGVSFVGDGNGTQLGDPAQRSAAASSKPVRLAAGRTTTSLLQIANAGDYDPSRCVPTTADGFRVYPPGSTTAVFVRFGAQACQRSTGSSPQLVASPVGTAG